MAPSAAVVVDLYLDKNRDTLHLRVNRKNRGGGAKRSLKLHLAFHVGITPVLWVQQGFSTWLGFGLPW